MCAHAVCPPPEPALAGTRERLMQQFILYRSSAAFWSAFQGMQEEVTRDHPREHVRLCNALADIAQQLGPVPQAPLIHRHPRRPPP